MRISRGERIAFFSEGSYIIPLSRNGRMLRRVRRVKRNGFQMIFQGEVPAEYRRRSQKNYYYFGALNGISYMCLGENILILLTIRLGFPDYVVSIMGAMQMLACLVLPVGRVVCARVGAARSQGSFWVARNCCGLIVALAGVLAIFGWYSLALAFMLAGAFGFYACRSAGIAFSLPLVGSFSAPEERGNVLGISVGLFYIGGTLAIVAISALVHRFDSVWSLLAVVVFGSCIGVTSSRFLLRLDESAILQETARKPLLPEVKEACRNRKLWHVILVFFYLQLAAALVIPGSMLVVKRGSGFTDFSALFLTMGQYFSCAFVSLTVARYSQIFGPRRLMLVAYFLILLAGGSWLLLDGPCGFLRALTVFMLVGGAHAVLGNSLSHYFLQRFTPAQQVPYTIVLQAFAPAAAGAFGMAVSSFMLKISAHFFPLVPLDSYRFYFALLLLLLAPGYYVIHKLTPLPQEKRQLGDKAWQVVNRIL